MSLAESQKEKIKLRASFLNGLAMGIMLIGAFTPITRAAYDPAIQASTLGLMAVLSVVCFVMSGVLHYYAMRVLNELESSD